MAYGPEVLNLVRTIRDAGIRRAVIDAAIPDWWEPDAEKEPGAVNLLKIRLARRFGLQIRPLLENSKVLFTVPSSVRFKRSILAQDLGSNEPLIAYCNTVAQNVAAAMSGASDRPSADPMAARQEILDSTGAKWINLNALLYYCWRRLNIAVLGLRGNPSGPKHFDAVTYQVADKIVVFLAKDARYHAWASFILAHELAHIALSHIENDQVLVDDPLFGEDARPDLNDAEEIAANIYALALLGGKDLAAVFSDQTEGSAQSLAEAALAAGKGEQVDPGHLVLRYARGSGKWATAQMALALFHGSSDDALTYVNDRALGALDLLKIGDEARSTILDAISQAPED